MKKEYKEDVSLQFDSNGNCLTRASNILMGAESVTFVDKRKYESLQKKAQKLKDALIAIENYINLAKSEAEVLACMLLARQAIKEFESDEGK